MVKPTIIGVAGGSASGKTTVVSHIINRVGKENLVMIQHDSYYRSLSHLPLEERKKQNFDHPASLETELLIRHLKALCSGYSVEMPLYDYAMHIRKEETQTIYPHEVILLDGILIFVEPELRKLMDIKIFVDTDDDIRLLRRIKRDIIERQRSLDEVLLQYEKYVRPMHLEFVEPTKRYADIIIPHGGQNEVALDMINALVEGKIWENAQNVS